MGLVVTSHSEPRAVYFESLDSPLFEFSGGESWPNIKPEPWTAKQMLSYMRMRVAHYGTPLPDGFVPPPGIDLPELLKQVPWPRKDDQ